MIVCSEVEYEYKIVIESVIIYETYNPGSVVALYAFDYNCSKWRRIWSIFDKNNYKIYKSNKEAIDRRLPEKLSRTFRPDLTRSDIYSEYFYYY